MLEEISDVGFGRGVERHEVFLIWRSGSNGSADEMRIRIGIRAGTNGERKGVCAAGRVGDLKFDTATIKIKAHCCHADRFLKIRKVRMDTAEIRFSDWEDEGECNEREGGND